MMAQREPDDGKQKADWATVKGNDSRIPTSIRKDAANPALYAPGKCCQQHKNCASRLHWQNHFYVARKMIMMEWEKQANCDMLQNKQSERVCRWRSVPSYYTAFLQSKKEYRALSKAPDLQLVLPFMIWCFDFVHLACYGEIIGVSHISNFLNRRGPCDDAAAFA